MNQRVLSFIVGCCLVVCSSCSETTLAIFPMPDTKKLLIKPANCVHIIHQNSGASAVDAIAYSASANPIKLHFYPQQINGVQLSAMQLNLSSALTQEVSNECQ